MRRATVNFRRSWASSPILPKHWWEGTDSEGRKRDISATTLEKPLGSGPYRIKEFVAGRSVVLERVKDYWGRDLSANVGRNNFDELRYEYFRNSTVALEAFKADQVDWRTENSAKNWATAYDFPAVTEKRVLLEEFPNRSSGIMQAFAMNIRRDKFRDPRVRRALNFAFDFEEMNKQIFFGQYKRISSYFDGAESWRRAVCRRAKNWKSSRRSAAEVPAEVFTTAYTNPVGGSPEAVRENLREALRLLKEAGYEVRDRKLVDSKTGAPFALELLERGSRHSSGSCCSSSRRWNGSASRSACAPSIRRNTRIGCEAGISISSSRRGRKSLSPGNEQREFWGSQAADMAGSRNIVGIKNPAIDKLIERRDFRQGPRRPDRGDQGARSRAAVESLRRAAVDLQQGRVRRAGIASAVRPSCRNTASRHSPRSGGMTPTRLRGSANGLEGHSAHDAIRPPACAAVSGWAPLAPRGFVPRWRRIRAPKPIASSLTAFRHSAN